MEILFQCTMHGFRALAYLLLACSMAWVASYRSIWYDSHIFGRNDPAFEFYAGDVHLRGKYSRIVMFFSVPLVLAALCGASFEAMWMKRQLSYGVASGRAGLITPRTSSTSQRSCTRLSWRMLRVVNFNLRPLGASSVWASVGEIAAFVFYILVMTMMVYQGVQYKVQGGDHSWTVILKNVAKYLGFAAAINFSLVLVPVSRDSKMWSAIGVPYERAILYHTAVGHLAFSSLFLHGFLYMLYYVLEHDWDYALRKALYYDGGGVNVPAGFLAGVCAAPMWLASVEWVRRRHYNRFFKTSHFLFVGVFVCGMVHYDGFGFYLVGGFTLYLVHMVSRLDTWKRWKIWMCWTSHDPAGECGSLAHLHTGAGYTRLVLRNPGEVKARGGMMVYLNAPSLLGTIEAHPMSVALRGAPPCLWRAAGCDDGVFTVYVKATGAWTKALHKQDSNGLLVNVDGFYSTVHTFMSMKTAGCSRLVLFAGGSGMTSFLAFIQDWCVALVAGEDVPEVHLVWSCRRLAEMQLLGEALPSMLASAGTGADVCFKISLFCSGEEGHNGQLLVEWPVGTPGEESVGHFRGLCPYTVFDTLNSGIRTVIAGGGAFAGWLWGKHVADGQLLEGVAQLFFMATVSVGTLIVYGWATGCIYWLCCKTNPFCASPWKRYQPLKQYPAVDDPEDSMGGEKCGKASLPVKSGRFPVHAVLTAEQAHAERQGFRSVKVLVSGPAGMVDSVMRQAREVNWKLFNTEAYSRAF